MGILEAVLLTIATAATPLLIAGVGELVVERSGVACAAAKKGVAATAAPALAPSSLRRETRDCERSFMTSLPISRSGAGINADDRRAPSSFPASLEVTGNGPLPITRRSSRGVSE